jgi:iron-sulfur cluster repair protein YtfE (RIC family)
MLRDPSLVPLSHQHQHALALCVRIGKAFAEAGETPDVHPWELEIVRLFDDEISFHFLAEEKHLFPAADRHEQLAQLTDELRIEHTLLRRNVEKARNRQFTVTDLQVFTASLSEHIRKEERQLFESMQRLLPQQQLLKLGTAIQEYFASSAMPGQTCGMHVTNESDAE